MNNTSGIIRDVILGFTVASLLGLGAWVFRMHYWQGTIDMRVQSIEEDADEIVRLLRNKGE